MSEVWSQILVNNKRPHHCLPNMVELSLYAHINQPSNICICLSSHTISITWTLSLKYIYINLQIFYFILVLTNALHLFKKNIKTIFFFNLKLFFLFTIVQLEDFIFFLLWIFYYLIYYQYVLAINVIINSRDLSILLSIWLRTRTDAMTLYRGWSKTRGWIKNLQPFGKLTSLKKISTINCKIYMVKGFDDILMII